MKYEERVKALLKTFAVGPPTRMGKHWKFKLRGGKYFTLACTPSDHRHWLNALRDLRRVLGLREEHTEGERREKKRKRVGKKWHTHVAIENNEVVNPPPGPELLPLAGVIPKGSVRILDRRAHNRRAPVVSYSPEIIAHVNFMRESGKSEEEIQNYFNTVKQNGGANEMTEEHEIQGGEIERALHAAQEKVRFHKAEVQWHQAEVDRWAQVAQNLYATLDLVRGKAQVRSLPKIEDSGANRPKGYWGKRITEVMQQAGKPMFHNELYQLLMVDGVTRGAAYQAVRVAVKHNIIAEIDGKLALESWTAPEKEKTA